MLRPTVPLAIKLERSGHGAGVTSSITLALFLPYEFQVRGKSGAFVWAAAGGCGGVVVHSCGRLWAAAAVKGAAVLPLLLPGRTRGTPHLLTPHSSAAPATCCHPAHRTAPHCTAPHTRPHLPPRPPQDGPPEPCDSRVFFLHLPTSKFYVQSFGGYPTSSEIIARGAWLIERLQVGVRPGVGGGWGGWVGGGGTAAAAPSGSRGDLCRAPRPGWAGGCRARTPARSRPCPYRPLPAPCPGLQDHQRQVDDSFFFFGQYDPPTRLLGRHNEVWVAEGAGAPEPEEGEELEQQAS